MVGPLTEGFLRYEFVGLIHGGAYFQNFTVSIPWKIELVLSKWSVLLENRKELVRKRWPRPFNRGWPLNTGSLTVEGLLYIVLLSSCYSCNCCPVVGFPIPELPTCRHPLGMESGHIPNSAITASSKLSIVYGPENARLHYQGEAGRVGAWIPLHQDHRQWLQVDFGSVTQITGISTQGYYNADHWVKSYTLQYSDNGYSFKPYQQSGHTKVLTGFLGSM